MQFSAAHADIVHDLAFDYFGKRLATCSSDQRIKIWNDVKVEAGHQWQLCDDFKAHEAAVLTVDWAHPQYGQVIASCSFDRTVRIWEEQIVAHVNNPAPLVASESGSKQLQSSNWTEKARLVDSRGTVQSIEFCPTQYGLKLATLSVEGVVRIYEAVDVVNLAHWTLQEEFNVVAEQKNVTEAGVVFSLSWCKSRLLPQMIVVGCGKDHTAKVYQHDGKKFQLVDVLAGHSDVVNDVAFGPSNGKSFEQIATACRDGQVRIFKLQDGKSELIASLQEHGCEVWRVKWNTTGSNLISTGDDGKVIVWKQRDGIWITAQSM